MPLKHPNDARKKRNEKKLADLARAEMVEDLVLKVSRISLDSFDDEDIASLRRILKKHVE